MRILILLSFIFHTANPAGNLDKIRRALQRYEYEKVYELLKKASLKEPDNPGIDYFSGILFSTKSYQKFNLDSSRIFINRAIEKFQRIDDKMRENLGDDGITMESAYQLRKEVRDKIYKDVVANISIAIAEGFMNYYPKSPYEQILIFKRDSIVFDQVRKNDSLGVYQNFLDQYSTTEFREFAIKRIDELRYQVLAHSGSLNDHYQFLKDYPNTKFRNQIEKYVFRVSNRYHIPENYLDFIAFAESEGLKKKAGDILYYMSKKRDLTFIHPLLDSIAQVKAKSDLKLLPALEGGKFGFHSSDGKLQISYDFENVSDDYKCQLTNDDWLFVSDQDSKKIISTNGSVLINDVEDYVNLEFGVAKVKRSSNWFLYHKSGFKIIEEPIEDASVMNGRWIKVKRGAKWALLSFSGYQITDYRFDDILIEGNYWMFEKEGLLALHTEELIEEGLRKGGLDLEFKFDDLELVTDKMLIGFRDDRECMLDEKLNFLIPWGVYEINPDESGWYLKTKGGYRLYDHSEKDIMNQIHPYLETNRGWLALKMTEDWMLLSRERDVQPSRGYDSLKLINEFCAYTRTDEKEELRFFNGRIITIDSTQTIKTFFKQPEYLLIEDPSSKAIINREGNELLRGMYDEITFFNDSLIKVGRDGKSGLLKLDGSQLIDVVYDAIDEDDGLVLCLKEGKIGCLDLNNGVNISAVSDARIERIGKNYLVKNDGKFGLVDSLEESILSFSFDEIRLWNDTSYLVRNSSEWSFLNMKEEVIGESVEFLTEIVIREEDKIWKFVREGKYGLLSNKKGFILDPEFTDIFNIGDEDDPIFFADQHLDKAGFHVVSYVNADGRLILSKAYSTKEFDKILCDD